MLPRPALCLLFASLGCAPTPLLPSSPVACPAGTQLTTQSDSDVGWGEVERTTACTRPDGVLDGPAREELSMTSTALTGRYAAGRRVGTWSQRDERTGAEIGSFTFDESGSGTEIVRDLQGHVRRGEVVNGLREGSFTHQDREGRVVATDHWARSVFVRRDGSVPWDPPMLDPRDVCPARPTPADVDDGCPPAPASSAPSSP